MRIMLPANTCSMRHRAGDQEEAATAAAAAAAAAVTAAVSGL